MQMLKDEYERLKAMIRDGEDNIDFRKMNRIMQQKPAIFTLIYKAGE